MKQHIVSFSGGKDSTAMLIRMLELGMPVDRIIFADTGKEFPEMYDHIKRIGKYVLENYGKIIEIKHPTSTWDDWFYGKVTRGKAKGQQRGFPLSFFPCWWSREAKFKVLDPVCEGHERYIGIAADEPKRITYKNPGYHYPLADWGWTEADCLKYLVDKGLDAQLHHDFGRTGCWCCPKQSVDSLKTLCRKYPDQWKELRRMESESPNGFKQGVDLNIIELEVYGKHAEYCMYNSEEVSA